MKLLSKIRIFNSTLIILIIFFKLNPLIPRSQTFLIEDNKILCGSPLDNKMIMNIFIDYIKN